VLEGVQASFCVRVVVVVLRGYARFMIVVEADSKMQARVHGVAILPCFLLGRPLPGLYSSLSL